MSRIGKLPIKVPANVDISWDGSELVVKGQFGTLQNLIPEMFEIEQNEGRVL
jgi:ribosomal protein L6P/L9E